MSQAGEDDEGSLRRIGKMSGDQEICETEAILRQDQRRPGRETGQKAF